MFDARTAVPPGLGPGARTAELWEGSGAFNEPHVYEDIPARWAPDAILALQHAAEAFLIGYLGDSAKCAKHGKRKTIMKPDMDLVAELRNHSDNKPDA